MNGASVSIRSVRLLTRLFILSFLVPSLLTAQDENPLLDPPTVSPWRVNPGWTWQYAGDVNGWGRGPTVVLDRQIGAWDSPWMVEFVPAVLTTSDGFYTLHGITGDLGPAWTTVPDDMGGELTLSLGATGILGSDSDGSVLAKGGAFVAARGDLFLTWRFGLTLRSAIRLYNDGSLGPGLSTGLVFRL